MPRQHSTGGKNNLLGIDEILCPEISRVWQANMQVYGADKVWKQMNRERITIAR